jgi:hypothetical protein
MYVTAILETGAAALLFMGTFVIGGRIHPFRSLVRDRRSIVSFGAGISIAYVFVHLMPELHGVRSAFAESVSLPLPYEGMSIYFFALVGFLVFYGLDHLRTRLRVTTEAGQFGPAFRLHVGGFAAYVWLMSYLLVHNLGESTVSTTLYALAIALHFLGVDHALREEHGVAYERVGRFVLAAMALLGWAMGLVIAVPHYVLALLVAFISGAIIMNSTIMELPSEKDGRFVPLVAGGMLYGLILLALG